MRNRSAHIPLLEKVKDGALELLDVRCLGGFNDGAFRARAGRIVRRLEAHSAAVLVTFIAAELMAMMRLTRSAIYVRRSSSIMVQDMRDAFASSTSRFVFFADAGLGASPGILFERRRAERRGPRARVH